MKRRLTLVVGLLFAFLLCATSSLQAASPLKWYTLEEAMEAAKKNPKPLLIDLYTDWCGWCKKLDADTFGHEGIAKYIGENFYPVKFNAEQREKRYYYHSDHLGSAQFVTDWKGRQYEHIEYTPYGELWIEEVAAGLDKLPFRFTGKEMDEETGLYYYGARYLDPKYSRWLSGDPALGDYIPKAPIDDEAKKHNENLPGMGGVFNVVNLHLYHYAGNNPVKYEDPDGEHIEVFDNNDGTYTICGGTINNDLSIYLTVDGQRTGSVLGVMFTDHSFFHNDTVVAGAMIDMNDTSGQAFLDDFKINTPSLITYIPNGLNGKKYDFKDIGNNGREGNDLDTYYHRGMQLGTTQGGNRIFGSARDVGNYAAGYAAGKNGLWWSFARLGFDIFQSITSKKFVQEGQESQAAQIKGFIDGRAYWEQMMKKCAEDH